MPASDAAAPAVSITRVLDAPRSLVWKVWTDPIHVMRWWGPHGFTVPNYEADVRPGGTLRYEMRAPDGTIFPATGTFEDVETERRLVLTGLVEIAGSPAFEARTTVTFDDCGTQTVVTVTQTYSAMTAAAADAIAGAKAGWTQQFEKLDAYLAAEQAGTESV